MPKPKKECKHDWRQEKNDPVLYVECAKCEKIEKISQEPAGKELERKVLNAANEVAKQFEGVFRRLKDDDLPASGEGKEENVPAGGMSTNLLKGIAKVTDEVLASGGEKEKPQDTGWENTLEDLIDLEADECTRTHEPNCHANEIIHFVRKEIEKAEKRAIVEGFLEGTEAGGNAYETGKRVGRKKAIKEIGMRIAARQFISPRNKEQFIHNKTLDKILSFLADLADNQNTKL